MLILSGDDLKKVLTMEACIDAMEKAFAAVDRQEAQIPLRTGIDMEGGTALFMPAYLPDLSRVSVKTVMVNGGNPDRGLPLIHAMVMIFDSDTGAAKALMDGEVITAMRTGAVSGLATKYLARKDARVAAIIGTGTQGETQLEAVCCARDIQQAHVFDLDPDRAQAFALKMGEKLGIDVSPAPSPECLTQADIICTATTSPVPVFDPKHIAPGTHINGVGAFKPEMAEIPPQCILNAKVVVDQMESCLAEAGDLIQPIEAGLMDKGHIHAELGNLVTGRKPAREDDGEITVFKSVGIAVQDLVAANIALEAAQEKKLGHHIHL